MMTRALITPVHPSPMTVEHRKLNTPSGAAAVNLSRFQGAGGVVEWHITVVPDAVAGSFVQHLAQVETGYQVALAAAGLDGRSAVWRRFFCSDIANQEPELRRHAFANPAGFLETAGGTPTLLELRRHAFADPASAGDACAVSLVGQAPLAAAKLALWACHLDDPAGPLDKSHDGTTLDLRRGGLHHLWSTNLARPDGGSAADQTHAVLSNYTDRLAALGFRLDEHAVRTWLFQPNIDLDYPAMVSARREFFASHGLTADTHFIASTGIAGTHPLPTTRVSMDAYAVGGLQQEQVAYLTALDHLGPTYDYGVTFERATAVSYQDRKQVFISGTASIDPHGQVVHPGDVVRQLDRTLGNIASLLASAAATLADMQVFLVYLRDPSDHARVMPALRERLGDAPMVVLAAPVCRPGWLIEIEGLASIPASLPLMPPY